MKTGDGAQGPPIYDFSWWPEVAGAIIVIAVVAFLFALASGSF